MNRTMLEEARSLVGHLVRITGEFTPERQPTEDFVRLTMGALQFLQQVENAERGLDQSPRAPATVVARAIRR